MAEQAEKIEPQIAVRFGPAVVISAPHWFHDPEFRQYLVEKTGQGLATWHLAKDVEPGEFSDVFVGVDPSFSGEGTDSDMPEHIWDQIVDVVRSNPLPNPHGNHIIVQISPV